MRTRLRPLPGDEGPICERAWSRSVQLDLAERLWPKVRGPWCSGIDENGDWFEVGDDDCWLWIPTTKAGEWRIRGGRRVRAVTGGYGRIFFRKPDGQRTMIGAHVAAYLVTRGAFAPGLVIDHICRAQLCCNPRHLRAVTQSHNVRVAYERRRAQEVA